MYTSKFCSVNYLNQFLFCQHILAEKNINVLPQRECFLIPQAKDAETKPREAAGVVSLITTEQKD